LDRLRAQAQQAWENRELRGCIEILERVLQLSPADTWALRQMGRVYGLLYDYGAAERFFEKSCELTPMGQRGQAVADCAQQARDFYDPSFAERWFRRAIAEKNTSAETVIRAAEVAERNRNMSEAALLVDRVLQVDGKNPQALFAHAHLEHRSGELRIAEQELRPLLGLSTPKEVRINAWYEMGAVLDRQGRYDEAMQAFVQAKALLRHEGQLHLQQRRRVHELFRNLGQNVTSEILKSWQAVGKELKAHNNLALLGGHPRSGTTLLEQVLDSHPGIVSIEETDHYGDYIGTRILRSLGVQSSHTNFFNPLPAELLAEMRSDYIKAAEGCIGAAIGQRLLIDKNPSLTISIMGLVRAFPEIRLLVALRDPRDVVLSCFMQPFVRLGVGNAMFLTLETAVEEYSAIMGMWLKLKSILPNPALEVRYEDMVEGLEPVARKVLEFLDVSWNERVLDFDAHARSKRVRSPTYADVTQKVFTRARGRWRNYEKYLEPHLARLQPFLQAFGYK